MKSPKKVRKIGKKSVKIGKTRKKNTLVRGGGVDYPVNNTLARLPRGMIHLVDYLLNTTLGRLPSE